MIWPPGSHIRARSAIFLLQIEHFAMKHVNLSEARGQLSRLLKEVEAGETLVIQPDPPMTAEQEEALQQKRRRAIESILEARKTAPRVTVEEILAWRDEGRRY
jgi:hypothetical protein